MVSLPDNLPIRAIEREKYAVKEYLDGGLVRATIGLKPVSYYDGSGWREIANDFIDSGIGARPHIVTDAPMWLSVGDGGTRRIHPTREADVYLEIGRPYNVATRQPYPMNAFTRSGNLLTSVNSTANLYVWMAGHYSKLGIELKGAWKTSPPPQVAFPVGLAGLTWDQGILRKDGVAVMHLSTPVAYDMDGPTTNRRSMTWDFVQLSGQWYVVLDLPTAAQMSGWNIPLIDPSFFAQPDGTAGKDTQIYGNAINTNYGTLASMDIGEASDDASGQPVRALIQPDWSPIPSYAQILTASMSLFVAQDRATAASVKSVYRLLQSWVETEATWVRRSVGNNWQTAGASGANDRESSAIGSLAFSASETINQFFTWSLTPSAVQEWVRGTVTNHGMLVQSSVELNDDYLFPSSDNPTAANRPKFEAVYAFGGAVFEAAFPALFRGAFG